MKRAKATPKPAIVTNPPLWANSDAPSLVVAKTVPADVVDEELLFPVEEALAPLADALALAVEFELVLPVALDEAVASVALADLPALEFVAVAEASVAADLPAFVVD